MKILLLFCALGLQAESRLWFTAPASSWFEALPIGNGRLAAMIFGGAAEEHLQLNEDSSWAGKYMDRVNPAGREAIPRIRRLLTEGKLQEAEELAGKTMLSQPVRMPPYQPLGDLHFRLEGHERPSVYSRELDLNTAIATTRYQVNGVTYTREIFASFPDRAIVIRLTASQPGMLTFVVPKLVFDGQAIPVCDRHSGEPKTGVRFHAIAKVITEGGQRRAEGTGLQVRNANAATILVVAATDYRVKDPVAECREQLAKSDKPFAQLRQAHVADYQRLYGRVSLTLGGAASNLPTDQRLKRVKDGAVDTDLEALYFQYGRYLLIASSRPGSLAANLQGKWNDNPAPPWESKYTININTEMNYWPAESTNLAELHLPLFDLLDRAKVDGRRVAKQLYGARGFVVHHNTDGWGHAGPIDGVRSGVWPMGGAWLSLHLWEHYDFSRDRQFLATRAYPTMKEAAEFFLDYLTLDAQGRLLTGPSTSPENRYRTKEGVVASLTMGPSMDTQMLYALFSRVMEASEILGVDAAFRKQLSAARDKLPKPRIGKHGQLQEWLEDYDEPEPGHRHISHLFALHPGDQISPRGTPELARAARTTLERRIEHGGGQTGWSQAWIINFWSRLMEPEKAHQAIVNLMRKSTGPNLFDTHPAGRSYVFQIDGNFGGTAGMAEMLLQSQGNEVAILPALPVAWSEGSVKGLRARGGITVGIEWTKGRAKKVTLVADHDLAVKLRVQDRTVQSVALQAGMAHTVVF
jgi:alpha-L-fucosidase 2